MVILLTGCQSTGAKPFNGAAGTAPATPRVARSVLGFTYDPGTPGPSASYYYNPNASNPDPAAGPLDGCIPQTTNVSGDSTGQIMQAVRDDFGNGCGFDYRGYSVTSFVPPSNLTLFSADYDGEKDVKLVLAGSDVYYYVDVINGEEYLRISGPPNEFDSWPLTDGSTAAIHQEYGSGANASELNANWIQLTSSQWSAFDSGDGPGAPFSGLYSVAGFADAITDSHGLAWTAQGATTEAGHGTAYAFTHPSAYRNVPGAILDVDQATGLPSHLDDEGSKDGTAVQFTYTQAANSIAFVVPTLFIDGSILG